MVCRLAAGVLVASCLGFSAAVQREIAAVQRPIIPGACHCMNWRSVYENGLAKCGDGAELISTGRNLPADQDFCNDAPGAPNGTAFYLNQDHEYCISFEKVKGPNKLVDGAWCYVSAACDQINGGSLANKKLKWKKCYHNQDAFLSEVEPKELFRLAQNSGKSNNIMALMAYSWGEVKGMFPKQPTNMKEMVAQLLESKSNKTALSRKRATHTITWKGQVWDVTPTRAVCVEGCPVK